MASRICRFCHIVSSIEFSVKCFKGKNSKSHNDSKKSGNLLRTRHILMVARRTISLAGCCIGMRPTEDLRLRNERESMGIYLKRRALGC